MEREVYVQGRSLGSEELEFVRHLIGENPSWSRRRLSQALCLAWDWRNAKGQLKDMACRTLLVKLHERGFIELPARRQVPVNRMVQRRIESVAHETTPMAGPLRAFRPLHVVRVDAQPEHAGLFACLLSRYHYLGYRGAVGENMAYLVLDAAGRAVSCVLFAAPAWATGGRDRFIGWDAKRRARNLHLIANNTRFLILPWVRVRHLASHVLGLVARRIGADWQARYGHRLYLLESFVDTTRFEGVCYRAANWVAVGQTQGRSRNDTHHRLQVPSKRVFLYPLVSDFRAGLNAP